MNMANTQYNEHEFEYNVDNVRRDGKEKLPKEKRRPSYANANRPAVHNGIHRRRNKRFAW